MPAGRFAPSPTGPLHVGNLRTAVLAWLLARGAGDNFWLRIEDLDPVAARPDVAASQLEDLAAVGLDWDGPLVWQSERRNHHDEAIAELSRRELLYPCYCTRREIAEAAHASHGELPEGAYPGTCRALDRRARRERRDRPAALRLRAEGEVLTITDRFAGDIRGRLDDMVVRRNDGVAAYNVAVVVDDAAMGVEEVVRGDDLLASTPRQVHIARLLGLPEPLYAHVPLVLGPDGERLGKRHGSVHLRALADRGVSAAAVRSLIAVSINLAEPGEPVEDLSLFLERFVPSELELEPWVVDPGTWI